MKLICSLTFAFAMLLLSAVQAAQLTYEMRIDPATSSPGVTVVDAHTAIASSPGDIVGVQLFAVLANANGDNTDDGFGLTHGSFVASGGSLVGDLRGDTAGVVTQQNNVPGANAAISQSGYAADLNGDGGLDVGDIANFGAAQIPFPWFLAVGGSGAGGTTFGTGATATPTEILIGKTTFTVGAGALAGQSTQVNYVPRMWTTGGTVASRRVNKFVLDGVSFSLASSDVNVATVGAQIQMMPSPGPLPVVATGNASDISAVAATLNGTVNPNGRATTAKFQLGLAGAAYSVDLPVTLSPANGNAVQAVSAQNENLTPSTSYHYRLIATSSGGTTVGADQTFTTAAPVPQPPVAVTGTATNIGMTSATLNGTINAVGEPTTAKFQVGLTASAYDIEVPVTLAPVDGTVAQTVSAEVTGLTPLTVYHYRIVATNSGGITEGADQTFSTIQPILPGVIVGAVQDGTTSVTLNGSVIQNGSPATAVFQWGETTAYGTDTPVTKLSNSQVGTVPVSATLTGLLPNKTYHYRLSATNLAGTVTSTDKVFHTRSLTPPLAHTYPATTIGANSATLNAIVSSAEDAPATAKFQYGLTTDYGTEATVTYTQPSMLSATVPGLAPGTTYHYRIAATNAAGTSNGADMTFTTLEVDAPQPPYADTLGAGLVSYSTTAVVATLNGVAGPNGALTEAKFEVGTTIAYGAEFAVTLAPPDGKGLQLVERGNIPLQPNTTYHCRLVATNAAGTTNGDDVTFTTHPLVSAPVIGEIVPVVAFTSAVLTSSINPGSMNTTVKVEYGETTSYGSTRTISGTFIDDTTHPVTIELSGLTANTTYHCRIVATNSIGTTTGPDVTFTTLAQPPGAWLTYEMRVDPAGTSPGVVVAADRKSAHCTAPGDVVALQLFAIINNFDGNNANDGFTLTQGSFVASSAGGLVGDLRGDTNFVVGGQTQQNNVPGANVAIAQSGFVFDLNGDGGLDVGDIANHGPAPVPGPEPWFRAVGGAGGSTTTYGTGASAGPTEILIGQTTYTVATTAQLGQTSTINYVPRLFTTGGVVSARNTNKFVLDGVFLSKRSDDPSVAVAAPVAVTLAGPPPPPVDVTPPTIAAPPGGFLPLTLTTGVSGTAELADYTGQAVTGDNVGVTGVTQSPAPGAVNVGLTHVVLTAHDAAGNTADTAFDVTVLDGTAPVITHAPDPVEDVADAAAHALVPDVTGGITATDNVAVTSITQAPVAGAIVGVGETNIVVTVADAAGNSTTAGVIFTVLPQVEPPPADRGRGLYSGLLGNGGGSADGLVTLIVSGGGAFSGKVSLYGITKGFQGVFRADAAVIGIPGFGMLAFARPAGGGIDMTLGALSGRAENSPYTPGSPAPMRGSYTVLLPPDPVHAGDAAFPQGTGFATLNVNQFGLARCVGRVGDGAPFAFESSVHDDGTLPCYDGLYAAPRGSLVGTLAFRDLAGSDLDGALAWSRPAQDNPMRRALLSGFSDFKVPAIGSSYQASATPLRMLTYNKTRRATVTFHDGGLAAPISGTATVRATPTALVTPPLREFSFSPGTGTFTGSLRAGSPGGEPRPFFGIVFQKQNRGAGFFFGAGTVGGIEYVPQPDGTAGR